VGAEIAERGSAEHGVCHCVCHDIGIAVAPQTTVRLETDPSQHECLLAPRPVRKGVLIKSDPYS